MNFKATQEGNHTQKKSDRHFNDCKMMNYETIASIQGPMRSTNAAAVGLYADISHFIFYSVVLI